MTELADKCRQIIELSDDIEGELKPYVKLYKQHVRLTTAGDKFNFWTYPGPQDNVDYSIRWDWSDNSGIHYEGHDNSGDGHSFVLPFDFIERSEEKAAELAKLELKRQIERAELEKRTRELEIEVARARRRQQYETLRKEFEDA